MDKLSSQNEVVSPERNKSRRAGIFIAQNSGGLLPYVLINFHSPQVESKIWIVAIPCYRGPTLPVEEKESCSRYLKINCKPLYIHTAYWKKAIYTITQIFDVRGYMFSKNMFTLHFTNPGWLQHVHTVYSHVKIISFQKSIGFCDPCTQHLRDSSLNLYYCIHDSSQRPCILLPLIWKKKILESETVFVLDRQVFVGFNKEGGKHLFTLLFPSIWA